MKRILAILISTVFIAAGAGPLTANAVAFAAEELQPPEEVSGAVEQAEPAEAGEPLTQAEQTEQEEQIEPAVQTEPSQPAAETGPAEQIAPAEAEQVTTKAEIEIKAQPVTAATAAKTTQPVKSRAVISKLRRPAIASLTGIKYKKICVRWQIDANADGYEIYYKAAKKKRKIIKTQAPGKYVLKGLKKGKKYTIKIRSYRVQNGKKIRSKWSKARKVKAGYTDWVGIQEKYKANDAVKELIFVKCKGGSDAQLYLYKKDANGNWQQVFNCTAYIGSNGINKEKEGDHKTPIGDFPITHAFGIQPDPGSKMSYLKVNKNHYWCGDDHYYNQLVDVSKQKHRCRGEHLIDYTKQYAYAMNIGYNIEGTQGKGSAIFLHCFGNYHYTLGCVAVAQENMIRILQTCEPGTRICIYKK